VVLGILALGLTGLKASGLTDAQQFRGHPDSVTGETVLAAHFPAGTGTPVVVIGNESAAAPRRRTAIGQRECPLISADRAWAATASRPHSVISIKRGCPSRLMLRCP